MANTKSGSKRARQTATRAIRNRSVRSRLRGLHKRATGADAKSDTNEIRSLISAIDKAAKRGIIHKNAAIRRKARLRKTLAAKAA